MLKSKIAVFQVVIILSTSVLAQERPPTAGTPPVGGNESNFPTILYPAIGAVVAGATYLLVKKRPSSIPATHHLELYLLNNGILPTDDALNLIYVLNPSLGRSAQIPSNYRITKPEFPDLPKSAGDVKEAAEGGAQSSALKAQVIKMQSSLDKFKKAKVSIKSTGLNQNALATYLSSTQEQLNGYLQHEVERNVVKDNFLINLLGVLNRTMDQTVVSGTASLKESQLIKDIADNINELLNPLDNIDINVEKQGLLNFRHFAEYAGRLFTHHRITPYLSHRLTGHSFQPQSKASYSKRNKPDRIYELQPFAFAVYKIDSNGNPITKGSEVEKRYQIMYVCPALKDYPEAYTTIETSATYAFEHLPAARFHLLVKDPQNRPVEVKNAVIDTRKAFSNQQKKYVDKHIIIPVLIMK